MRLLAERPGEFEILDPNRGRVTVAADAVKQLPGGVFEIERGIASVVRGTRLDLALWALLIFLPAPFLQSQRLVWMLGIQDVRLSLWESIKLTFAGNFFNFALPGTVGGDLVKAYYLTRYTHHKTEAITTVFLDRVIGLLGLMMLATLTFCFAWNQLNWDVKWRTSTAIGLAAVWCGLAIGSVFVFSQRLRNVLRLSQIAAQLPAGDHLLRIGRATVKMRQHKTQVIASLVNTFVLQALVVWSAWVMSLALGMQGGALLYFICVPIGFLIAAVPISPPQAFGVMEYAYIQFFTHDGLNDVSQAFAFALAVRITQLVWALPGVLVPLLGAHLPRRDELEALQQVDEGEAGATELHVPASRANESHAGEVRAIEGGASEQRAGGDRIASAGALE